MEESILYDKIALSTVCKWRKEIEKEDSVFKTSGEKHKKELSGKLSEELMKEVEYYKLARENELDDIYYNVNVRLLNLGIMIGMQLQQAFYEMEEE